MSKTPNSISLLWELLEGKEIGDTPLQGYRISFTINNSTNTTDCVDKKNAYISGTFMSCDIGNIDAGQLILFKVYAYNSKGIGYHSEIMAQVNESISSGK